MRNPQPATADLEQAAIAFIAGRGRAIYKRPLYLHVARQAIASAHGFTDWADYKSQREADAIAWLESQSRDGIGTNG